MAMNAGLRKKILDKTGQQSGRAAGGGGTAEGPSFQDRVRAATGEAPASGEGSVTSGGLRRMVNKMARTKLGGGYLAGAENLAAHNAYKTPTSQYRKRLGINDKPGAAATWLGNHLPGDAQFYSDLGVRTVGVGGDIGNTILHPERALHAALNGTQNSEWWKGPNDPSSTPGALPAVGQTVDPSVHPGSPAAVGQTVNPNVQAGAQPVSAGLRRTVNNGQYTATVHGPNGGAGTITAPEANHQAAVQANGGSPDGGTVNTVPSTFLTKGGTGLRRGSGGDWSQQYDALMNGSSDQGTHNPDGSISYAVNDHGVRTTHTVPAAVVKMADKLGINYNDAQQMLMNRERAKTQALATGHTTGLTAAQQVELQKSLAQLQLSRDKFQHKVSQDKLAEADKKANQATQISDAFKTKYFQTVGPKGKPVFDKKGWLDFTNFVNNTANAAGKKVTDYNEGDLTDLYRLWNHDRQMANERANHDVPGGNIWLLGAVPRGIGHVANIVGLGQPPARYSPNAQQAAPSSVVHHWYGDTVKFSDGTEVPVEDYIKGQDGNVKAPYEQTVRRLMAKEKGLRRR